MASRLDEIAVALTQPMSRRRAMRLTLGAAATAYLGLPAGRASSQRPCQRTPVCEPGTRVCVASRPDGCPGCCTPSEKCCVGAPDNANTACCDEAFGYDCGPLNFYGTPSCACKPENTCQGINDPICCRPEEKCIVRGGQEPVCCKQPCGKEECCYENEDCVMGERLSGTRTSVRGPVGLGNSTARGAASAATTTKNAAGMAAAPGSAVVGVGVAGAAWEVWYAVRRPVRAGAREGTAAAKIAVRWGRSVVASPFPRTSSNASAARESAQLATPAARRASRRSCSMGWRASRAPPSRRFSRRAHPPVER